MLETFIVTLEMSNSEMSSGLGGHLSLNDFLSITKEFEQQMQKSAKNKIVEDLFIFKT